MSQYAKALTISSTVKRTVKDRLKLSRKILSVLLLPSGLVRFSPNCDSTMVHAKLCKNERAKSASIP